MRVFRYQVFGHDEKTGKWRRRRRIENAVERARLGVEGDEALPSYLDAIARETNQRLRLVAIMHEAAPMPCLRVQRSSVKGVGNWTMDAALTLAIQKGKRRAKSGQYWFDPARSLSDLTERRIAYLYRIAVD